MKMSFSLSSLQPSSESPERAECTKIKTERPYNSLTKKRKEPMSEQCAKYWSGPEDSKDDFWAAIQTNYDYIMDTNLIDTCKETNGELTWDEADVSTMSWGLKEVSCQFSELDSWLRVLQELVYSKEENVLDKSLRAAHTEELRRKAYRRRLFNEQAEKLIARTPSLKEEVSWRVDHLNTKWDLVEQIMSPVQRSDELDNQDVSADFEHEVKCLRKWLREMEDRLQPLKFHVDWSRTDIEEKAMEHMVLQKDIEAHGRIVSSVVKLGERVAAVEAKAVQEREIEEEEEKTAGGRNRCDEDRLKSSNDVDQQQQQQQLIQQRDSQQHRHHHHHQQPSVRVAASLERRWHLLFLRSLEWQCHIEALAQRVRSRYSSGRSSSDSDDEEPVSKQPRLSRRQCGNISSSSSSSDLPNKIDNTRRRSRRPLRSKSNQLANNQSSSVKLSSSSSDSENSIDNRSILDEGSYFEDDLDDICSNVKIHQDQSKAHRSNTCNSGSNSSNSSNNNSNNKRRPRSAFGDQGTEADIEEAGLSEEEADRKKRKPVINMSPTPDTVLPVNCQPSNDQIDSANSNPNATSTPNDNPKRRKTDVSNEDASFNSSNRKSKNCATFYFKHNDTDSDTDLVNNNNGNNCKKNNEHSVAADESSEEEWHYKKMTDSNEKDVDRKGSRVKLNFDDMDNSAIIKEDCKNNNNDVIESSNSHKSDENRRLSKNKGSNVNNISDDESRKDIQRLIREVETLIHEDRKEITQEIKSLIPEKKRRRLLNKYCNADMLVKVKKWLELDSQRKSEELLDSGDASFEYTTGESDIEKNDSSEEELKTNSTRRNSTSIMIKSNSEEILQVGTPKVTMRTKTVKGPRPWSVSCLQQIKNNDCTPVNPNMSSFSISESTLHKIDKSHNSTLDAKTSISSSTLLEEVATGNDTSVARNSSIRRKKSKLRKKNASRKSEYGSDGVTSNTNNSDGVSSGNNNSSTTRSSTKSNRHTKSMKLSLQNLRKIGPLAQYIMRQENSIRNAQGGGEHTQGYYKITTPACETDTDEDEDITKACARNTKNGKPCSKCEEVLLVEQQMKAQFASDSDMEKGPSSFSEQAWDNYQEKYMSEPYSETADTESARRLLEFGDDYHAFLGSQSDCVLNKSNAASEDCDSDKEFKQLTETSRNQLLISEAHCATTSDSNINELTHICRENLRCLQVMSENSNVSRHSDKHSKQIRGLMERWESLSLRAEEAQKINAIHREMSSMKLEFCAARERFASYKIVLEEPNVIEERINRINNELANLRERKAAMLALNVSTHRLITDLGQKSSPTFSALKDGVAELYKLWDEAFQKGNQQLNALQAVQQFGLRLVELQNALSRDKDTLAVLDAALQAGATMEVASSVRDVARLLSEKHEVNNQSTNLGEKSVGPSSSHENDSGIRQGSFGENSRTACSLLEGGSLSDSGISDSGSEQELSERERRLAVLRRLTRSLESQLDANSCDEVLAELWKRVEDAEAELRKLQKQCRELIVRTAASVESKSNPKPVVTPNYPIPSKRKKIYTEMESASEKDWVVSTKTEKLIGTDDPENDPDVPQSWVWRVLRAALPFQLAIVVLFCAACLLEPHCCEVGNSLNLSLTPQLRYMHGPPPV